MPDEQPALDLAGGGDEKKRLPILMLDFDGVLHSYSSGWQGADRILDPPVAGFAGFLERAVEHFQVCVHSSRSAVEEGRWAMRDWLRRELHAHYRQTVSTDAGAWRAADAIMNRMGFPKDKPAAFVSLDDRCLNFTGVWPDIAELRAFRPWWG
ncbi:MAG TPA: hypothetical protein VGF07_01940 [Stellaceae bacterium]|jgi:hypothetical protein